MSGVNYLERWKRKSDGALVIIASVTEFSTETFVHWRRPQSPGQRARNGRLTLDSFLKRYEFLEPAPEAQIPVMFPPEPKSVRDVDLVLMALKAARNACEYKAMVWREVVGDEGRARALDRRAVELRAEYREYAEKWEAPGAIPVTVFEPTWEGRRTHTDGFEYDVWAVRENAPRFEYLIVGTNVTVAEVDGGNRYGRLLAVVDHDSEKPWLSVAGPSSWSLENALHFAHKYYLDTYVFAPRADKTKEPASD